MQNYEHIMIDSCKIQQTSMKCLAILIILIQQMADCKWYQEGHWTRQLFTNNSFIFSFLGVEQGYVQISGSSSSADLQIILSQNKGSEKNIQIKMWMITEKYQTDPVFHTKKSIKPVFHTEDGTTYGQQEIQIWSKLPFNITLTHRKQLELRSTEGVFLIKLINIEQISPRIYYYLWLLLIIVVVLGQAPLFLLDTGTKIQFLPSLGFWSSYLIIAWLIKYAYNIFDQSYYLTDTFWSSFLAFISFVAVLAFSIEIIALLTVNKKVPLNHWQFTLFVLIMAVLLLVTFIPLKLWYCLVVVIAYEIVTICYARKENTERKRLKIAALMILYLFPFFIFPAFSFEIRYPQPEVEMWWIYGIFYFVEAAVFLLKSMGGVCFKFKRLKLKIQRQFNSQAYLTLQEKSCPLCLKEVQISEIGMNAAGEAPQVDWIQAGCNHHFHKACVRQNLGGIDCCLFDKIKWSEEFKQSAQK